MGMQKMRNIEINKMLVFLFVMCGMNLPIFADEPVKHVIVVGVDAMSPDGIRNANTPNIDYLIKNGSSTMQARAVLPTDSKPNWASMIMGAGPEQHGITSNGWKRDDHILPPLTTGLEDIFPTIFGVIREQMPSAEIGAIYDMGGFGRLFEKSAVNYDIHGKDEQHTAELAATYIKTKKPFFTFIQLDHVDHEGHKSGHGSTHFYEAVTNADSLIGQIFQAAEKANMLENGLFIVAADHGGYGHGHGGEMIEAIEIPLILFGKNVKKGHSINHAVNVYDNAATVAFALGVEPPFAWIGRPIKSSFLGHPDPVGKKLNTRIASPVISPPQNFYDPPGGFFLDASPTVKIESDIKGADIFYTLDGTAPTKNSLKYEKSFRLEKSTVVLAKVFKGENVKSLTSKVHFRILKSNDKNGIHYSYFEGKNWSALPVFADITPVKTGKAFQFRLDVVERRVSPFGILFNSYLKVENTGEYKFYTYSDDGSKLFIDGEKVVDNDGDHGTRERSGVVSLDKGMHQITVQYFNGGGGAWLDIFYRGPGIIKQIIPPELLYLDQN
jgi:hypothetical protein